MIFYPLIANPPNTNPSNVIEIINFYIQLTSEAKYLRVILDNKLSFQSHLDQLKDKLSRAVGILTTKVRFFDISCLQQSCYATIHCHLECGTLI